MTETDSQPIAENEQVKELLALLKDNNTPGYEEFSKLIEHVTGMEQRLLEATEELKAVRQEMQGLPVSYTHLDVYKRQYLDQKRTSRRQVQTQRIRTCRRIYL